MLKVAAAVFELKYDKFSRFLYSGVEEEPAGVTVTVLSLLSRTGCDPWMEAKKLSKLSNTAAVSRLARSIFSTCASCRNLPEAEQLAARLIERLPAMPETQATNLGVHYTRERFMTILAIVFAFVWLLLVCADRHPVQNVSHSMGPVPAQTSSSEADALTLRPAVPTR